MKVHARFRLDETTRIKMYAPAKAPLPDGGKWEYVPGVRVKLSPVQGEPFGSATPGGQLEMVIANPEAAKFFHEAELHQEFDVVFTPVEKAEA
jgi:hypothetical protein